MNSAILGILRTASMDLNDDITDLVDEHIKYLNQYRWKMYLECVMKDLVTLQDKNNIELCNIIKSIIEDTNDLDKITQHTLPISFPDILTSTINSKRFFIPKHEINYINTDQPNKAEYMVDYTF
jgi:hypothetical protein